jgi:S-adenosylmethionine:tRNA ribosyltransferase-isomerase
MTAEDRIDRRFAKLLVADANGVISHLPRAALGSLYLFQRRDLVVANDAATLPASLQGVHRPTGEPIQARLAGWVSFRDPTRFIAVVFGAGDYSILTEDRAPSPPLLAGDQLEFGPLIASVRLADHPRLVRLGFAGSPASVMRDLVRYGRPIQYAHIPEPLMLWDV